MKMTGHEDTTLELEWRKYIHYWQTQVETMDRQQMAGC